MISCDKYYLCLVFLLSGSAGIIWLNLSNLSSTKECKTYVEISDDQVKFNAYLTQFNKSYYGDEYLKRFGYYMKSLEEISYQNRRTGAKHGPTKFSDLSRAEFAKLMHNPAYATVCRNRSQYRPQTRNLYADFFPFHIVKGKWDWRDRNAVGPVLNQKRCNGCWAFGVVGVMESMDVIQRRRVYTPRSIQELLDCSTYDEGCFGGHVTRALDFLYSKRMGIITQEEYPLKLIQGNCNWAAINKHKSDALRVSEFTTECKMDESKIVNKVYTHGPVMAVVNAAPWQHYTGGIIYRGCYRSLDGNSIDHIVQIVGYNLKAEIPYYIIRNSWGEDFGIDGYVKLAIWGDVCGISDELKAVNMVTLKVEDFGTIKGETVKKFTWKTGSGFSLSAISYGAIIQAIKVPDRNGLSKDIVLGFDDLDSYVSRNVPYLGAAVGRCANRIGGGSFEIDGVKYQLAKNVGEDHLHGGLVGFDKVNWKSTIEGTKVTFSYLSKDGEEGYPGDVLTNVTYDVTDNDVLLVTFIATTSKKTVINLTNHSYFNLAGHDGGAEELYEHVIVLNADRITETTSASIPTGKFIKVGDTPFDLRTPIRLGTAMEKGGKLFDDNFCVNQYGNKGVTFVSRVTHPSSGRTLEVYSNQPGVQLYTSNFLPLPSEPALVGKNGVGYRKHGAFCLETQNYPDAVHHENFPKVVLSPGEVYEHLVQYRFGVQGTDGPKAVLA